jgi:hypothetical protein
MTDPYVTLGEQLAAAAAQQRTRRGTARARSARWRSARVENARARSPWLSRRLNVAAALTALLLACAAVAVAATGLLNGAPVSPEVAPNPDAGNGVPVAGERAGRLALLASDPAGGLPWGLRVLHTTRGQMCVQVGRVQDSQLGELGLDGVFGDDGRFHSLSSDVLPPGYGGSTSQIECVSQGQTLIFEDADADRNGVRLLPWEFSTKPRATPKLPPATHLRTLAYGLLGPHAVSMTYRTADGLRTVPIRSADGAFLIVEAASDLGRFSTVGGSMLGEATANAVDVILGPLAKSKTAPIVSAVTFRFGAHLCSQGVGAPVGKPCPAPRPRTIPQNWFKPTRSLHEPVGLKLLPQSRKACAAAFLLYPCYKGQISFRAPYAVRSADTDYNVNAVAKCKVGGRPETSWSLERDVRTHELIHTISLGLFVFTPACASTESFQVTYLNQRGPSRTAPHPSVVIGSVPMSDAVFAGTRTR